MSASKLDPKEGLLVYTDGACGKSEVGGWAFIAVDINKITYECSGYESNSTNNRMELMAAVQALEELDELYGPCEIEVVTDSKYVSEGITDWVYRWEIRGWITSSGSPVKNTDLWKRLMAAVDLHDYVGWRHVRGHMGHEWNEKADVLAVKARLNGDLELLRSQDV